MSAVDPIGVLEAAYAPHASERSFIASLAHRLRPLVDPDTLATHGYIARGPRHRDHDVILEGAYPRPELERRIADPLVFPPVDEAVRPRMLETMATSRGIVPLHHIAGEAVARFWGHGVRESIGFVSADGCGRSVVVAGVARTPLRLDPGARMLWQRVAVHVGAARRLLGVDRSLEADGVESICEPDGRVVDARGLAQSSETRSRIREAVRARDRARTGGGRADPGAALHAWSGLLAGRWTLLDHFDADGRRFVVARKNDPDAPFEGGLTRRQRQVALYASLGWSNAEIGYGLGLATSTVSMHLGEALRRLRLGSRLDLIKLATRMAAEAFAGGSPPQSARRGHAPDVAE